MAAASVRAPGRGSHPELIDREIRDTEEDVTDTVDDATRLKAETRLSQFRTMNDALAA